MQKRLPFYILVDCYNQEDKVEQEAATSKILGSLMKSEEP